MSLKVRLVDLNENWSKVMSLKVHLVDLNENWTKVMSLKVPLVDLNENWTKVMSLKVHLVDLNENWTKVQFSFKSNRCTWFVCAAGALPAQYVKSWPADQGVTGSSSIRDGYLSSSNQGSIAHSLLISLTHPPDMNEILLKRM